MRLLKLETKGFKSFADRTVVHFNKNITGIVGPNGCGKSNILDAIRWVLGEQKTRMLRSDKMENVIFNGSNKRKAAQMAEVSLTFENTKNLLPVEYSTVTITRKLYRSGESEYRLNDVPCRLKDITGLFMDTGIGSDSYAIIELAMVDEILNDKDNARLRLFEHAAGITKYKARKKETLQKLENTQSKLERIEDLLHEIESNLKALEKQARKAKRYQKFKAEYRDYSIELARHRLQDQQVVFDKLKAQEVEQQDAKTEVETSLKKTEAKLEQQKQEALKLEKALAEKQKALNLLLQDIREEENKKSVGREKISLQRESIQKLKEQISEAKEEITNHEEAAAVLSQKLEEARQVLEKATAGRDNAQQKLKAAREDHARARKALEAAQQELQDIQKDYRDKEREVTIRETRIATLNDTLEQQHTDREDHETTLKTQHEKLKALEDRRMVQQDKVAKLEREAATTEKAIEKVNEHMDTSRAKLADINRKLDARQNEYDLTQNMVEKLEGFPESIRFLKQESRNLKNAPLLSDIITCPEDYKVAIESYLEPWLSYYVVPNARTAHDAIDLLVSASKGRAHFFIRSAFDDYKRRQPEKIPHCTPALDIVQFDRAYAPLCHYLLDKLYLVSEAHADELSKLTNRYPDLIFLTQNGRHSRTAFTASGGSAGLFSGKKLGRVKNLERLEKQVKQLEKERLKASMVLEKAEKELEELRQAKPDEALKAARQKLEALDRDYHPLKAYIEQAEAAIKDSSERRSKLKETLKQLKKAIEEYRLPLKQMQEKQAQQAQKVQELQEAYNQTNDAVNQASDAHNRQNEQFHHCRSEADRLQQEHKYKAERIKAAKSTIEKNKTAIAETKERLKTLEESIKSGDDTLHEKYEAKEKAEAAVNKAEERYYEARGKVNTTEKESRELRSRMDQAQTLLQSVRDEIQELRVELSGLKERLSVEFGVELEKIMEEAPSEEYDADTLREKVDKVKNRLENFGEINPMAIQAHEEMQKRHDFITQQRKDMHEARNALLETIDEIDDTARKKFMDTFETVREHFIKVFRTLFSEQDDCDLRLTNPDEPLISNIDIVAKPKGKRPLSINQLSGGEKSLTAIALLFGLYLMKPAPFCIFDEVDAPLDDTNVGKFTHIIRAFSRNSQFILITHNKQTIASVDVIYGVTMTGEGVSRVVPVDFSDMKEAKPVAEVQGN